MAREFAYRLMNAPAGRDDGSGQLDHDIMSVYRDDDQIPWDSATIIPGYHKTFVLPSDEVETVMDMPDSTGLQRTAKNQAYKNLMILHWNSPATPNPAPSTNGWTDDDMRTYMAAYDQWEIDFAAANAAAAVEAGRVNTYITVTIGETFPVNFQLE